MATVAERVAEVMADAGGPLSLEAIAAAAEIDPDRTQRCLRTIARRRMILRQEDGRYRLTDAGLALTPAGRAGAAGPSRARRRATPLQQRIWSVLRKLKKASGRDLVELAGGGGEAGLQMRSAARYMRNLESAGVVCRLRRYANGHRDPIRWLLVKNLGPVAPCRSAAALYDPNADRFLPLQPEAAP